MTSTCRTCVAIGLLTASLSLLGRAAKEPRQLAGHYHRRTRTTQFFERVPHAQPPAPALLPSQSGPPQNQVGQSAPRAAAR